MEEELWPWLPLNIMFSLVLVVFVGLFVPLYNVLLLKPRKLRSKLQAQGITGPPPSFLFGNITDMKRIQSEAIKAPAKEDQISHLWPSSVFPYFDQWRREYGTVFTYSLGSSQVLYVGAAEVVKDISQSRSLDLGKPSILQKERGALFGQGIINSNGSRWVHQRKIIAPEFYMDRVYKEMRELMVETTGLVLDSWGGEIENEGGVADIRVDEDMRSLSADIISRACFGSNYYEGKEIFQKLRGIQKLMSKAGPLIGVPGLRYVPTKKNREIWKLDREISSLILKVVTKRSQAKCNDFLQKILNSAKNDNELGPGTSDKFIVDNCKNIYFAGHETTAVSASWSLMLLATHPEWQTRVRDEVAQVCGGHLPNTDMLRQLKTLTMVIQETMRLYPPATFVAREAFKDMKFGDIQVPKGLNLWIPIHEMQQDPLIWGPDSHKFNPQRFEHGISGACKLPHAYMPFGVGPRTCVGQNFAMMELKIILSLILSRFSFCLSPNYCHSPTFSLVIEPEHGVNLQIRKV